MSNSSSRPNQWQECERERERERGKDERRYDLADPPAEPGTSQTLSQVEAHQVALPDTTSPQVPSLLNRIALGHNRQNARAWLKQAAHLGAWHSRWRAQSASIVTALMTAILGMLILFLRKPDALLNAQLWAEDGKVFLRAALLDGPSSIFEPQAGYLVLVSRLMAFAATRLVPLEMIPLAFNVSAMILTGVVIYLLMTSRIDVRFKPLFALMPVLLIRARIGDFDLIWVIAASSVGERYLYLPHVFLAWCILWALVSASGWIRIPIGVLVIVIATNIARSWSAPALPDLHWTSEVSSVGHIPIQVPINPVWSTGPWKATVCRLPCSIDR